MTERGLRRHDRLERELFADPDVRDKLLLFALATARLIADADREQASTKMAWPQAAFRLLDWTDRDGWNVLRRDVPRYEIPGGWAKYDGPCEGRRRSGRRCDKPGHINHRVVEWHPDGTATPHFFCRLHYLAAEEMLARVEGLTRGNVEKAPPNRGGALARHFRFRDESVWERLYAQADPAAAHRLQGYRQQRAKRDDQVARLLAGEEMDPSELDMPWSQARSSGRTKVVDPGEVRDPGFEVRMPGMDIEP